MRRNGEMLPIMLIFVAALQGLGLYSEFSLVARSYRVRLLRWGEGPAVSINFDKRPRNIGHGRPRFE